MSTPADRPPSPIQTRTDEAGHTWYVVICPGCQGDISEACFGRHIETNVGTMSTVMWPLRCPACGQPLLEVVPLSPLVIPRGGGN